MTVLGIAGPGDPLANPERTFATFRMLVRAGPGHQALRLDQRSRAARRRRGAGEAQYRACHHHDQLRRPRRRREDLPLDLLEEQADPGPRGGGDPHRAAAAGARDAGGARHPGQGQLGDDPRRQRHSTSSRSARSSSRKGAFLHNVMPLIAEAEHGTFYGIMGQRGPTRGRAAVAPGRVRRRHEHDAPLPPVPGRRGRAAGRGPRRRVHDGQDRRDGDRLRGRHEKRRRRPPRRSARSSRSSKIRSISSTSRILRQRPRSSRVPAPC